MSYELWLVDRATALAAYPVLFLATLTGVFFSPKAKRFGTLHTLARRIHVEIAVLAALLMVSHAVLGVIDAGIVFAGMAPAPAFPMAYFAAGVTVGIGAFVLLVVAILGFVDARRFRPPWDARVVHSFAYAGFGFATLHAVAIGTDITRLLRPALLAALLFVGVALCLRLAEEYDVPLVSPSDGG